ncbi:DinB family protein [Naumannella sp. ID2617S]|nr:DinB family protein [Naumannella sp. ID2617S]
MSEIEELVETLARHRGFLLQTAEGLSEEQARSRSTVSKLTVAALLKHVADTEEQWMHFAVEGANAFQQVYNEDVDWERVEAESGESADLEDSRFVLEESETLPVLRERVLAVGRTTAEILRTADLESTHPLPEAPWFEPGVSWSVRRVAIHMLAEISQHAGHADIIREAIDGQRTMG